MQYFINKSPFSPFCPSPLPRAVSFIPQSARSNVFEPRKALPPSLPAFKNFAGKEIFSPPVAIFSLPHTLKAQLEFLRALSVRKRRKDERCYETNPIPIPIPERGLPRSGPGYGLRAHAALGTNLRPSNRSLPGNPVSLSG